MKPKKVDNEATLDYSSRFYFKPFFQTLFIFRFVLILMSDVIHSLFDFEIPILDNFGATRRGTENKNNKSRQTRQTNIVTKANNQPNGSESNSSAR